MIKSLMITAMILVVISTNAQDTQSFSEKPGYEKDAILLIVHLAHDNDEMQAIAADHPDFGATWRQRDLEFVSGDEFREMLKTNGIQLVTWKQIQEVMYP